MKLEDAYKYQQEDFLRNNLLKCGKTYSMIKKKEGVIIMTQMKERAVELIERMPDDNMFYVINILQNIEEMSSNRTTDKKQEMEALQNILKFSGRLPEWFDADRELERAREERYGNIG